VYTELVTKGDFGDIETLPNPPRPIAKALHEVQTAIVNWLRYHGFNVRIA
jgi:hypothetical protein